VAHKQMFPQFSCVYCWPRVRAADTMLEVSDWRQIQARIRKARTSADPPGQLAELYERTRDAMVAFELAQIHEKSGAHSEAARWYTSAAERFRRAQWKQKAEEALTRLGAPIPVAPAAASVNETSAAPVARLEPIITEFSGPQISESDAGSDAGQQESVFEQQPVDNATPQIAGAVLGHRRKRRGRRGGRGRNKGARPGAPMSAAPVPPASSQFNSPVNFEHVAETRALPASQFQAPEEIAESRIQEPEPARSFEPAVTGSSLQMRARAGDPALSSRITQLESQLRRLLACSLHSVDQPEDAPAGPGVFLITDTDQTCYYYIESCQTLRVGIGNLLRSGRGSREGSNLKEKLADHLGINEARVGKYLKDHCVVRWLQLDEGAPLLSHFAVAVLRPVANE
jgi:hypothetical protein